MRTEIHEKLLLLLKKAYQLLAKLDTSYFQERYLFHRTMYSQQKGELKQTIEEIEAQLVYWRYSIEETKIEKEAASTLAMLNEIEQQLENFTIEEPIKPLQEPEPRPEAEILAGIKNVTDIAFIKEQLEYLAERLKVAEELQFSKHEGGRMVIEKLNKYLAAYTARYDELTQ